MYIVGAHMDGIGWGEAANDDGSGTAIVMELARILHQPGLSSERSIRFILFNNEESGLNGLRAGLSGLLADEQRVIPRIDDAFELSGSGFRQIERRPTAATANKLQPEYHTAMTAVSSKT